MNERDRGQTQSASAVRPRALYENPRASKKKKRFRYDDKQARSCENTRTLELRLDRLGQLRALDNRVHRLFRSKDGVKVGHVHGTADARLERRLDLLLRESLPVDLLEKRMAFDFLRAVHA